VRELHAAKLGFSERLIAPAPNLSSDLMVKRGGKSFSCFLGKKHGVGRHEINVGDRKFIFESRRWEKGGPEVGERAEAPWVIRVMPRGDGFHFQCQCNHVNLYFLTVEPTE
jgi:hypothetical protein